MPLDPAFEASIRDRISTSAFASWIGMRLVGIDHGSSELAIDLQPHHLNPGGIVHGGVIAAILDAAIGLALRTTIGIRSHVTTQLDVHYLAAARGGTIVARGTAVHAGARTGYGEASVTGRDGVLLARGSASFLVLDSAPPAGD